MKDIDMMELPPVRRRRRSPNRMLTASLMLSILASVALHFLFLMFLGKVQIKAPLLLGVQKQKQVKEELDWFIVTPVDPREEEARALASGLKQVEEQRGLVRDDNLLKEEFSQPAMDDSLAKMETEKLDLPTPELSDEALEAAFKTVKLTGVEVEKADLVKPDVLSATVPDPTTLLPPGDEMLEVPDARSAAEPSPGTMAEPELKGTPEVVSLDKLGGGLAPVLLPDASRGTGWRITAGSGRGAGLGEGDGPGAGPDLGNDFLADDVGIRGGLDGQTGDLRGGGVVRRPTAVLGVKVRLGTGLSFSVPGKEDEESVEDPLPLIDEKLLHDVRLKEGGEALEASVPLDQFVNVSMRVEPDASGGGYYEVRIEPNEKCDDLADVAKDVLFIIDHSGSIRGYRLTQFKDMTRQALSYLNAQDRFNIVSFTSTSRTFFDGFVAPTKPNLDYAYRKLRSLTSHGQTDVFGGVGPYVKRSNGNHDRPLIVFLMTDGQSTVDMHKGEFSVDNTKVNHVLRTIAVSNPGNVSIYPFSAGDDADRVLLDFMARLNRGAPCHVMNGGNFRQELSSYMRTHMSLMVRKFRYIAEGEQGKRIYPRSLPHLYRSEPLSIYGRYETGEKELVLTLLGYDSTGKLRNLVFKRRFSDCEEASCNGVLSVSLREQWIAQKALHLLAEWVVTEGVGQGNYGSRLKKRQELNRLLGKIAAFSKYSSLLKAQ